MKQSSSTAQNMLIEEVKVRGEVFRTDALESENKGVQAFAIVIPLSAQEQWLFLSGACSSSRCVELSCWIFPEAPEVHSCLCRLEFFYMQSASSPPACPHGRE